MQVRAREGGGRELTSLIPLIEKVYIHRGKLPPSDGSYMLKEKEHHYLGLDTQMMIY